MRLIGRLSRGPARHTRRVGWLAIVLALLAHMLLTRALLAPGGEDRLVAPQAFPYHSMTTGGTVGYGDVPPQTPADRECIAAGTVPYQLGDRRIEPAVLDCLTEVAA